MTLSFTSFSIKDILTGRDVHGPVGEMSTGGYNAPQPTAGNFGAEIKTRNWPLGNFQQGKLSDNLSGSCEDITKLSNIKGDQQIRHVYSFSHFYYYCYYYYMIIISIHFTIIKTVHDYITTQFTLIV